MTGSEVPDNWYFSLDRAIPTELVRSRAEGGQRLHGFGSSPGPSE